MIDCKLLVKNKCSCAVPCLRVEAYKLGRKEAYGEMMTDLMGIQNELTYLIEELKEFKKDGILEQHLQDATETNGKGRKHVWANIGRK